MVKKLVKAEEVVKKAEEVKVAAVKRVTKKSDSKVELKPARYFEARGGRKTAVARVRLSTKFQGMTINGKDYKEYFKDGYLQKEVEKPLGVMNVADKLGGTIKVSGGGLSSQAEAVRHGISRALVLFNADFRKRLRRHGFLTRDARMVERKKYGLKKARRAPQWAKR